jgi:Tfp pilus assembly PilM family ATPase
MCGASSNLPGLAPYLAEVLSVEVLVGNPFIKLGKENDNMNITDPSTYSVALGLALKDF